MKEILKYSIWIGLYVLLIVPFIVATGMFFPYITGKAFTFRIIVEIIFGLWLILALKDRVFRPRFSWVFISALALTAVLLIADIFAVAPFKAFWSNYERMEGWVAFIHLFAYLLVLGSMLNTEKLWLWFLRINSGLGLIMAIMSLAEGSKDNVVRVAGPLGNPIYIGVYFLFIFFFTLILLYKDVIKDKFSSWVDLKKISANVLFYIYLIVSILSLYITYSTSRGVLLGALGGIFVAAVLVAIFEKNKKVIRQIALGIVVVVIAVIVLFFSARQTNFVQNNPTLSRLAEVSWDNVSGQARQLVWPMAIKGFKEKPILGWGQDGFNYVFNKYYDPRMYDQEQWFDRAHNVPLDFLIAGGILGLLSYLSLFIAALCLLWFRKSFDITEKALLTGLLAGYFFQGIFVFDNLVGYMMFFVALAYVHFASLPEYKAKENSKTTVKFLDNQEYQNYIFIPIIVAVTAVGVWWINVPAISANTSLIQSLRLLNSSQVEEGLEMFKKALAYKSMGNSEIREQLLSITPAVVAAESVPVELKQEYMQLTFEEVQKQIDRVPNDARYYILMASFLINTGNYEKALPFSEKAVELSPQKQAMRFALARNLLALDRKEEALAQAKIAYESEPKYEMAEKVYKELQSSVR